MTDSSGPPTVGAGLGGVRESAGSDLVRRAGSAATSFPQVARPLDLGAELYQPAGMTYRTVEELGDLVDQPVNAVLATRRDDDTTLLSPVWFIWRDNGFDVGIPEGDPKLRHLARDPRVTILIFENGGIGRGLEVTGTAVVTDDEDRQLGRRLSVKYLGERVGNEYAARLGPGMAVRIEGRVRAWDYADLEV